MKVTAFVGSHRKKHTHQGVKSFLENLGAGNNIELEVVRLSEYNLKPCEGCLLCMNKGEELCPLKDDRDILIDKMIHSDGIVFATPNYSFQVSGIMKLFIDRLGYLFHRPRFFGKTFTSIVTQGIYGGRDIIKYLNFIGKALGFNVVKGSCLITREPLTEKVKIKNLEIIKKQSRLFYKQLIKKEYPTPSLFELMLFRMSRTSMHKALNKEYKDFQYFLEKDWFTSSYYYPVKLNPFKRAAAFFFDKIAEKT